MDTILDGLRDAGSTVFEEEKLVTQDGRRGREVGFLDPDGHLVVAYLIETAAKT